MKSPLLLTYTHPLDGAVKGWTAFDSMAALLNARGSYRPSLNTRRHALKGIAKEYNRLQAARGDHRRANTFC